MSAPFILTAKGIRGSLIVTQGAKFSCFVENDSTIKVSEGPREATIIGPGGATGGMHISGGGTSIVSSGNVVILSSGGRVIVNGVDVTDVVRGKKDSPPLEDVRVLVTLPPLASIALEDIDNANVDVPVSRAALNLNGVSKVVLKSVKSLTGSISGSSNVLIRENLGSASLSLSGSADFIANDTTCMSSDISITIAGSGDASFGGEYINSVKATLAGSADLRTRGEVMGDYIATVSGSGDVNHRGGVLGRIVRNASGSGDIDIT